MKLPALFWNAHERRVRAVWRLVLQAVITVVLTIPPMFALVVLAGLEAASDAETPLMIVVSSAVLVGGVVVAVAVLDRRHFADLGLRFDTAWFVDLIAGLLLATLSLLVMFGASLAMGWIEVETVPLDSAERLQLLAWLVAFSVVGFGEEFFSRGYQMRNIAEGLNGQWIEPRAAVVAAAVLSGVVFGVLHIPNPNMTPMAAFNLCVAGLVLALPVVLTGRLALAVGFHTAWNYVMGNVLGFPVSGLAIKHSLLRVDSVGPDWITGGAFGPEGGVIGLVTDALSVVLIVAYVRVSEGRLAIASGWAHYRPPAWRRLPEGATDTPVLVDPGSEN